MLFRRRRPDRMIIHQLGYYPYGDVPTLDQSQKKQHDTPVRRPRYLPRTRRDPRETESHHRLRSFARWLAFQSVLLAWMILVYYLLRHFAP